MTTHFSIDDAFVLDGEEEEEEVKEEVVVAAAAAAVAVVSRRGEQGRMEQGSSQWSFSTLSSVTHLSAHCCGLLFFLSSTLTCSLLFLSSTLTCSLLFFLSSTLTCGKEWLQPNFNAFLNAPHYGQNAHVPTSPFPLAPRSSVEEEEEEEEEEEAREARKKTSIVIQLNPDAVYHVTYISCAVHGRRGFRFFYLPYFEK
ncbi:hypothetical protein CRUP_005912 [Coryphaenoides rupestris]|nr:hypothetical protein CRUP_005912 [Coryphaenoides rupestris]